MDVQQRLRVGLGERAPRRGADVDQEQRRLEVLPRFDELAADAALLIAIDDVPRMMSVGLHPRATGNPARADALARFIEYGQSLGDVWFARRIDIANTFSAQEPSEKWVGLSR